jgi:hypothetical protein
MVSEVISRVERRRHWPRAEKLRILSEATAPGAEGGYSYAHPGSVIHAVGRFGVAGSTTNMDANTGGIMIVVSIA